jgi:outer membrane protein
VKKKQKSIALFILIIIITPALLAAAEQSQTSKKPAEQISAGAGVLVSPKPYKGADSKVYPIPLIFYRYENFYINGKKTGYTFYKKPFSIFEQDFLWKNDVIADIRFDGYDASDEDVFDGMSDRDWTLDAGLSTALMHKKLGRLTFQWLVDILNKHNGYEMSLKYDYPLTMENLTLTPAVGFKWQSQNLVDYYYGVQDDEVTAARPAYDADSTTNWFTSLTGKYDLNKEWSIFSMLEYEFYGNEIEDSPIVSDDDGLMFMGGILYNF